MRFVKEAPLWTVLRCVDGASAGLNFDFAVRAKFFHRRWLDSAQNIRARAVFLFAKLQRQDGYRKLQTSPITRAQFLLFADAMFVPILSELLHCWRCIKREGDGASVVQIAESVLCYSGMHIVYMMVSFTMLAL